MFVLWKDHTSVKEAEEINELARKWEVDFTKYEGGIYSSEWFWAKLLHVIREDAGVYRAAYSWVEHCDWIPALLTGNTNPKTLKRSRCAAGHKAMWHEAFDGLPSEEFLTHWIPCWQVCASDFTKKRYLRCSCRNTFRRVGKKAWTAQKCCGWCWSVSMHIWELLVLKLSLITFQK
jgi:hypothetical protein